MQLDSGTVSIIVFLTTQTLIAVWWASRVTTTVGFIRDDMSSTKETLIATILPEVRELDKRVLILEQSLLVNNGKSINELS